MTRTNLHACASACECSALSVSAGCSSCARLPISVHLAGRRVACVRTRRESAVQKTRRPGDEAARSRERALQPGSHASRRGARVPRGWWGVTGEGGGGARDMQQKRRDESNVHDATRQNSEQEREQERDARERSHSTRPARPTSGKKRETQTSTCLSRYAQDQRRSSKRVSGYASRCLAIIHIHISKRSALAAAATQREREIGQEHRPDIYLPTRPHPNWRDHLSSQSHFSVPLASHHIRILISSRLSS